MSRTLLPVAALLLAVSLTLPLTSCSPGHPRPNILLITLDTTRADHLGCYGYARDTSPNLDRLAGDAVVYDRAVATSSWTLPSHASIFTGKFTTSHGMRYDPEGELVITDAIEGPERWKRNRARGLSTEQPTLAALLQEAGYATGAVVGGPWLKRVFGLDRGFQFYDDDQISTNNGRLAEQITPVALRWLRDNRERPWFLFLNYFDPHAPYQAPEPHTWRFENEPRPAGLTEEAADRQVRYDGEIFYMDLQLGVLIEGLKTLELYDRTMIVVTSDHGELLGEHDRLGHGRQLYEEEVRVPLIVKHPRGEASPQRLDAPIQPLDVFNIVLDRAGVAIPPDVQGGLPPHVGHPLIAEVYPLITGEGDWRALWLDDHKLMWNSLGRHRLFDLGRDPHEQVNLYPREPALRARMETLLAGYLSSLPRPVGTGEPAAVDEETLEALRSLGYLD